MDFKWFLMIIIMKQKSICLFFLLALLSGGMQAQKDNGYKVNIQLGNQAEGRIMVSERVPNTTAWFTDTLQLKSGKTVHTGKLKDPCLVTYSLYKSKEDFIGTFSIFLDNSPRVQVKGKDLRSLTITGSPTNDEYQRIEKEGKPVFSRYASLRYQYGKAFGNKALRDSLEVLYKQSFDDVYSYIMQLPNFAESKVVAYYVYDYLMNDSKKLKTALAKFSPSMDSNVYIKYCKEELARQEKIAVGRDAYDFCLSDIDGKQYRLSDYRGKYVLMEFSASWCGWCKKEIPFLKKVYEAHKDDKNFQMFTINLDDKKEKWEKDVKELNLPWPVISDLKAFNSEVTDAYNVHGIPMIFLISPEGKIVANNLRGENMIKTVAKHLEEMNTSPFSLKGSIQGFNGGRAYLYTSHPENRLVDSCDVKNDSFILKGRLEKSMRGFLFVRHSNGIDAAMSDMYLQPGDMGVDFKADGRRYIATYSNAPLQAEYEALVDEFKGSEAYKKYKQASDKVQKEFLEKNSASPKLQAQQCEALFAAFEYLLNEKGRSKSEAMTSLLNDYSGLLTIEQLETLCKRMDASLQDSYYLTILRKYIAEEQKVATGKLAINFTAKDLNGKEHSLSDFQGKYIFLEFSASWCSWCKKEIPFIRKAYETLKDKNIVFITLMMDDKRERWVSDVEKYNIEWLNLSDLKGIRNSEIAKNYNVSAIPASFVINPDGIIIDRDLRGERILSTLKGYLK